MILQILFIVLFVLAGVFFVRINKKTGIAFFIIALLFLAGIITKKVMYGTTGNIIIFLFHGISGIILFFMGIRRMNKKRSKIAFVLIGGLLIIVAGCIFIKPLRRVMAISLKPYTKKDGITRSLFVNCFYKEKVPGFDYAVAEKIEYYSEITKTDRQALVLLPKDYDENKTYPVLYLLHGLGGNEGTWLKKNADIIIQNMHYLYGCPEMIVVFPNSNVNENNSTSDMDNLEKCKYYDKTEAEITNNLMPYINEHYSVKKGREHTAVAGNSMGGRNAIYTAFTHQDLFGYVGGFSSVSVVDTGHDFFPPLMKEARLEGENFKCLMIMTGREDFICGNATYELHDIFCMADIEHVFYDVIGVHQDLVWQNALYNFIMALGDF